MYEAFYGLRERPFNLTPDPKFLYLSDKHKEAFAHLLYGIKNRSGFVMISGEIGTGKTTLCRNMLSQMDANTEVAFIFNPFLNPVELLKKINQEFGIISDADNVLALTEELNAHLLSAAAHGKNSVLVIDEAQNLEPQVLEQIRLLSNLETDSEKLLQIILIGQPELAEKLALHELRQLNQRITARYHLKPLNSLETLQYIAYRIHVAGGRKKLNFTKGGIKAVYKKSGGVPRMINALCDRALLIGYTKEEHVITAAIVRQAAREIRGEKLAATAKRKIQWRQLLPSPTLVVLLVVILALAHYLVDPLDRFANELSLFNRILSGDTSGVPPTDEDGRNTVATVEGRVDEGETVSTESPAEGLSALKLVMDRLNPSNAVRPSTSLAAIFTELDPTETLHAGVDALVSLWNHNLAGDYPTGDDAALLALYFQRHSLACEYLRPTAEQLLRINVPGLVRLVAGDNRLWMTLLRMDEESITLQAPENRRITVSHEEFSIYYGREFLAPWRDPAPDAPVLQPGQRGVRVRSLKEQLHALGRLDAVDLNDVYDQKTEQAIIALQTEAGLTPDGKTGPQVRLTLTSWSGNTPALRRGNARTAKNPTARENLEEPADTRVVQQTEATSAQVPVSEDAAVAPVSPSGNDSAGEEAGFQAVAENTAAVNMATQESPVMTLPDNTLQTPSEDQTAPMNELPGLLFQSRPEKEINAAPEEDANQTGLMEVRELPKPFSDALSRPDGMENNSVTPPVFGSSPLVPSGIMQP
jgi:general secretion pathway protein A